MEQIIVVNSAVDSVMKFAEQEFVKYLHKVCKNKVQIACAGGHCSFARRWFNENKAHIQHECCALLLIQQLHIQAKTAYDYRKTLSFLLAQQGIGRLPMISAYGYKMLFIYS